MLSLFAIASLVLSLSVGVLADGAISQEQQVQLAEAAQLPASIQGTDHLEKRNEVAEINQDNLSSNDFSPHRQQSDIVILHPDGQWHKFVFGEAGSTVHLKFVFNLRAPALLDITDLFCPGDAFRVIDNGQNIGRTPLKRADGCKVKTSNPDEAFACDKWSHRSFELGKGKHVIEIKVIRSPYCGGAGAIRLNPIIYTCLDSESGSSCSSSRQPISCSSSSEPISCSSEPVSCSSSSSEPVRCSSSSESSSSCSSSSESSRCSSSSESSRCSSSSESSSSCSSSEHRPHKPCGEFTVVTSKVPFCEAEQVCRALGLKLANLTNENFLAATEAAFRCSGEFSQTWIKSWYGDTYQNSPLVLSTGADAPGGAINVPHPYGIELPVLCQRCEEGDDSCDRRIIEHSDCESEKSDSEECSSESESSECKSSRESNSSECKSSSSSERSCEESEPKCVKNRAPFVLINKHVPFCEAASVCKREGLELAQLDDANFLAATTIAFREGGANRQSWIGSWNGDHYEGTPLALSTGTAAPGGSINHPDDCERKLPVLCQRRSRRNYEE